MAIKWENAGLGVEHGTVNGTRLFTVLHPSEGSDGHWTLTSDLPGQVSGRLVSKKFSSARHAKMRAHIHLTSWLRIFREGLEAEPIQDDGRTWWERPGDYGVVRSVWANDGVGERL